MKSNDKLNITFSVEMGVNDSNDKAEIITPESPFSIAILGDFTGRENQQKTEGVSSTFPEKLVKIDKYDFKEVFESMGVTIQISPETNSTDTFTIPFRTFDDFHPDELINTIPKLKKLFDIKRQLFDSSKLPSALKEYESLMVSDNEEERTDLNCGKAPVNDSDDLGRDIVESLLRNKNRDTHTEKKAQPKDFFSGLLNDTVGNQLTKSGDTRKQDLAARLDNDIQKILHSILNHRDFQSIEAIWQSLYFLLTRLDSNSKLKIYLVDISKNELADDLLSTDDIKKTKIYKLLVENHVGLAGSSPWSIMIGNYTINANQTDIGMLKKMALLSNTAVTPFIAGADPSLLGAEEIHQDIDADNWMPDPDSELTQSWESLRQSPEAKYIGLTLPRFLLRLPYGQNTQPCSNMVFDEMPDQNIHQNHLWGNSAFLCAYLLADAFNQDGWNLKNGLRKTIEDLPLHLYNDKLEILSMPCAEALLSDKTKEAIFQAGIIPIISMKDSDKVLIQNLCSIQSPQSTLKGSWLKR